MVLHPQGLWLGRGPHEWPSKSLSLTPWVFFLWVWNKQKVYPKKKVYRITQHSLDELEERIRNVLEIFLWISCSEQRLQSQHLQRPVDNAGVNMGFQLLTHPSVPTGSNL